MVKPINKNVDTANKEQKTINDAKNFSEDNIVTKTNNQESNCTGYKAYPTSPPKNILKLLHSIRFDILHNISPLSVMLDFGNRIIKRRLHRVN